MIEVSIILPGYRDWEWKKVYESCKDSLNGVSFELIIVGPENNSGLSESNVRFIKDFGAPGRCFQIGASLASGKYLTWICDDGVALPGALKNCYFPLEVDIPGLNNKFDSISNPKDCQNEIVGSPKISGITKFQVIMQIQDNPTNIRARNTKAPNPTPIILFSNVLALVTLHKLSKSFCTSYTTSLLILGNTESLTSTTKIFLRSSILSILDNFAL